LKRSRGGFRIPPSETPVSRQHLRLGRVFELRQLVDQFAAWLSSAMRTRLLTNDLDALRALTQNRKSNADGLPTMTMPCLLFVGEKLVLAGQI
jgi:hypothetical protein